MWYCLNLNWGNKGIHTFPTCPKINIIAQLKFELAYYDIAVQHVNHYTMVTFHLLWCFRDNYEDIMRCIDFLELSTLVSWTALTTGTQYYLFVCTSEFDSYRVRNNSDLMTLSFINIYYYPNNKIFFSLL